MRTILAVGFLLGLTPSLVGADDVEALLKEGISGSKEAEILLKAVTDKKTAETALPKLKALEERMNVLKGKIKEVKDVPRARAFAKHEAAIIQTSQAVEREVVRIQNLPEAAVVLKGTMFYEDREATIRRTRVQLERLSIALEQFKLNNEKYPAKLADLTEKRETGGPYIRVDELTDPWGRPYLLDLEGPKNKGFKPDVWSQGSDSKKPEKIIGNWPEKK